jgi:hypothetical protein
MKPSGPQPTPIEDQHFNISQPIAPEPTRKYFKLSSFFWNE